MHSSTPSRAIGYLFLTSTVYGDPSLLFQLLLHHSGLRSRPSLPARPVPSRFAVSSRPTLLPRPVPSHIAVPSRFVPHCCPALSRPLPSCPTLLCRLTRLVAAPALPTCTFSARWWLCWACCTAHWWRTWQQHTQSLAGLQSEQMVEPLGARRGGYWEQICFIWVQWHINAPIQSLLPCLYLCS